MTIRVLFVCHGNICRSPMAEFILKKMVKDENLVNSFIINSAATSREEIIGNKGNPIYPKAKKQLLKQNVNFEEHYATQIVKEDYDFYDYILYMDQNNYKNILKIIENDPKKKCYRLLDFANISKDVPDPWYTDDFDETFELISLGCKSFLDYIKRNNFI